MLVVTDQLEMMVDASKKKKISLLLHWLRVILSKGASS